MAQKLQSIPLPDFLNQIDDSKLIPQERKGNKTKHQDAYDAFCKWAALPEELRDPPTQEEFERIWHLPKKYTSNFWVNKEDFQAERLKNHWNWVFDKLPDIMHAVYRRAMRNSSADAKIFLDIVGKRLEVDAPKSKMLPLVIMGVPQEKIDALFTPQGYQNLADKTIEKFKVQEAEVISGPVLETEQA